MTDMTTARALSERYFPGQGRSLSTTSVTPPVDTLIAIPFDAAGEFDVINVLVKSGGSGDAVMRAGIYDSDANGLPDSLIEDAGEYSISNSQSGMKDMPLSAPLTLSLPYWVVLLFGGTTMPPLQGSGAIPAAEMQRVLGLSSGSVYAGIYNVAVNNALTAAFPYAALPATFPTPTIGGSSLLVTLRTPV